MTEIPFKKNEEESTPNNEIEQSNREAIKGEKEQTQETESSQRNLEQEDSTQFKEEPSNEPVKPQFVLPAYLGNIQAETRQEKKILQETPKPIGSVVSLPPGFTPRSTFGPIEGHPLEGFDKKVVTEETPKPNEQVESNTEVSSEKREVEKPLSPVTEQPTTQTKPVPTEESLFPEVINNPKILSESGIDSKPSEMNTSKNTGETSTETPKKIVPSVTFRSDKALEEIEKPKKEESITPKLLIPSTIPITAKTPVQRPIHTEKPERQNRGTRAEQSTKPSRSKESIPPTTPLQRPESSQYRGGGQRGPSDTSISDNAIRPTLTGRQPANSEKSKPIQSSSQRVQSKRDTREDKPRIEKRDHRPRDEDENSKEALVRKINELTPKERKTLNELLSNKRISRNLNEILEQETIGSEQLVEKFASPVVLTGISIAVAGLTFYGYLIRSGFSSTKFVLWFAFVLMLIWILVISVGLRAIIIRERARAKFEYDEKLKLELNIRSITDRINSEIAPRIPEMMNALKKLLEKSVAK